MVLIGMLLLLFRLFNPLSCGYSLSCFGVDSIVFMCFWVYSLSHVMFGERMGNSGCGVYHVTEAAYLQRQYTPKLEKAE
jgi:hypothetical protein